MAEFFFGFFVAVIGIVLIVFANWTTTNKRVSLNQTVENDFDYNKIEKSLEDYVDSPFDSENYFNKSFKREGTK